MIRGLIGEARAEDQQRIGALTAEVQMMQQARDAPAVASAEKRLGGKSGTSSFARTSYAWAAAIPTWCRQWKIRRKDR